MPADLEVVFQPAGGGEALHKIDIIFVPGLNPKSDPRHAENTWTHESGTMWPRDLLPGKIPYARICIFKYNSSVALDVSEMGVRGHANSLLDLLQGLREETETDSLPLILVGHSLGGLVVKQALVLAKQNDRVYSELLKSTKSLAFFATPHRGGNGTTLGQVAVNAVTFFSGNLRNDLVETLKGSSKYLAQLSADFAHQYENYDFLSVVETRALMRAPIRTVIVDPTSAIIGLAGHREQVLELDRDHRQICKFIQDSDYNRVARHLKRFADAASRDEIPNAANSDQGNSIVSSLAPGVNPPPGTMKVFSTLNLMDRPALIGQNELLGWLETFERSADSQSLLIKGPSGTGKSSVVREFASRLEGDLSVFWFCAESPETIQQGFKLVSHRISQEHRPTVMQNGKKPFKEWLASQHHARWLAIFDNAHQGLDLRDLLPCKGGKVIITSRHSDIKTDVPFITKIVSPLSTTEATDLFLAKWKQYHRSESIQHTILPSAASILTGLRDRPLAIVLAASCVALMRLADAQEQIQILDAEESPDEGPLDKRTWRWFYHLLDELTPTESNLLTLLSLFDSTRISDEFLDFISSGNLGEETTAFSSRQYNRSLQRLISLQLVQRCSDPWKQYLCMPMAIRECLSHHISMHQDLYERLAREGMDLLHSAFANINSGDDSLKNRLLEAVYHHCRALCLSINQHPLSLSDGFLAPLSTLSTYALRQATSEARRCCHRQYMRAWLLCNNFNLPDATSAEDDGAQHIDPPNVPSWISEDQDTDRTSRQRLQRRAFDSISGFLVKDVKQCLLLGAVGRSWHGAREEIFQYTRELPHAPRDSPAMREIINSIDKGGCAGLQSAVAKSVRDESFNAELLGLGRRSLNYIAEIVTSCILDINDSGLPEVTSSVLESAVTVSMDWFQCYSFHMIGGAFDDLFDSNIKEAVCSVIEPSMTSGSNVDPDSFETVTGFMVDTFAGSLFRERSRRVARGYWEVVGAMGLFFAADVLLQLSVSINKAAMNSTEQHSRADALMTKAIDLTREGIMGLERKQTPGWKLSVQRAASWCLQAEQCRSGWMITRTEYNYRNQERWEDTCISVGVNESASPISSLV